MLIQTNINRPFWIIYQFVSNNRTFFWTFGNETSFMKENELIMQRRSIHMIFNLVNQQIHSEDGISMPMVVFMCDTKDIIS